MRGKDKRGKGKEEDRREKDKAGRGKGERRGREVGNERQWREERKA